MKSLLGNFNNTLLITLEHKELGGGHRAAKLWIGLISEGEGSDPYISYTGVTLPDLRQISHLTQLFAITKCGIHYKRFFFSSCLDIISYCSCENGNQKSILSVTVERRASLFFFLKDRLKVWINFQIVRWNWALLCVEPLGGRKWQASGAHCIELICKYKLLRCSTILHHEYFSCCTFHTIVVPELFLLTLSTGIVVGDTSSLPLLSDTCHLWMWNHRGRSVYIYI